ncbi:16S rRNA (guanine(966)-N(2))-methyltransferase RsmD [candidate division WWE3 bacterium]|nr:16S rRNA (guanine(966)-N(2))-methyltransferase RsmD [candidate division WWE3 bacterium]
MFRITSGSAKGIILLAPEVEGFRAVQDKAKLAIFSMLSTKILKANCLDLYSGSGNLGIEALSRGAAHCDFVDDARSAIKTIQDNLIKAKLSDKAEIIKKDAIKYTEECDTNYDIIFADPFFVETHHRYLFENMSHILKENGVIVFSHGKDTDIKDAIKNTQNLEIYDTRRYGSAFISIFVKTH